LQRFILVVDDDQDNLTLVSRALEHEGHVVRTVASGEEALASLKVFQPDLMLLDINMSGISGLETLQRLRALDSYVSVIFVSAKTSTEDVVRGLDAGADDYICKPFDPHELLARVRTQLRIKDLNDQLSRANKRLQELVDIDDLTGLYNMRSIYQRLDTELSRARRYGRPLSVVMLDMDNFKSVNDGNDHLFGSFVLAEIGKIIKATIRSVDFAARYGGDEFLIALPETTQEGAELFCERLRQTIAEKTFNKDGISMKLSASLGIGSSEALEAGFDARNLVRVADHALYEAKRAGKNRVHSYAPAARRLKRTS
jgi:two-component system, cell cycle response regulator